MQVSAVVYNDTGQGERWSVAWNDAGFRCTVSHLSDQDIADVRDKSFADQLYLDQVDEQAWFPTIAEAHAYFHHGIEQWRRAGADELFSRIELARFPAALSTRSRA